MRLEVRTVPAGSSTPRTLGDRTPDERLNRDDGQ